MIHAESIGEYPARSLADRRAQFLAVLQSHTEQAALAIAKEFAQLEATSGDRCFELVIDGKSRLFDTGKLIEKSRPRGGGDQRLTRQSRKQLALFHNLAHVYFQHRTMESVAQSLLDSLSDDHQDLLMILFRATYEAFVLRGGLSAQLRQSKAQAKRRLSRALPEVIKSRLVDHMQALRADADSSGEKVSKREAARRTAKQWRQGEIPWLLEWKPKNGEYLRKLL